MDLARVQATAFKRYLSFWVAGEDLAKELLHEDCAMQLIPELHRPDAKKKTMLNLNEIKITPRDEQVLRLLVQGCSNKEIASQLKISPRTVKQHLRTLFLRAGIRDGRKRVKLATAMFQKEQVELCNRKTA
jgi:DNA-binding NarL/FixJ family response regulator